LKGYHLRRLDDHGSLLIVKIRNYNMTYLLEHWKPVIGYEGLYEVSNCGGIYSVNSCCRMKWCFDRKGYPIVYLWKSGKKKNPRIHKLVAATFIGKAPLGREVNHKDGWKANARRSNFEYITGEENRRHAVLMGVYQKRRKLSNEQVRRIKTLAGTVSNYELARMIGADRKTIWRIVKGENYVD
jgi:hypothetical protein